MKKNKLYRGALMLLTVMTIGTATTSCSDWNDHYDANSNTTASSGATLWENITSNSNLSQFATLLKKAGFADKLNTSQVYTVWAPLNGTYENDYNSLLNTDSTTLLNEFVYNHVARFNHPASGTIKDNIMMLNAKKELFSGSTNNYAFAGVKADTVNLPSSNGIFHVINGKTTYMTNLYEYLSKRNSEIDSIGNYFKHYEHKILDTENSVPGPTVNGEITYLDSVFIKYNSLFYLLNKAYIDEEDSSYTMIVPTNTAWNKAYNKVNSYFNYLPSFVYTNRANFYSSTANDPKTIDIDNYKFLKDSASSSSATGNSSSSFAISSLPAYKAEDQVIWKMKAYIVDKFGVGLCYGMPGVNYGMDDEAYNSSLDEIGFIEKYFSVTYERTGASCENGVGLCNYEYTEVDEIMRKFNEIRLVTDGEHIYAIFRDAECSYALHYQGEIIPTGDGFTDHIEVVWMETNIPC